MKIFNTLNKKYQKNEKSLAVLIDPDKADQKNLGLLLEESKTYPPDIFLIGGSLISSNKLETTISHIKSNSNIPVVIFPGSNLHISNIADGILFLSLISGRNPDFLIGQHVVAAPILAQSDLEIISTGYILVDCGQATTVSYMSNTTPIPYEKSEIAVATAQAGEMLGMKQIYLEGGSGAIRPVSIEMIQSVKEAIKIPLIVGGGIRDAKTAQQFYKAGADMLVIGNILEKEPHLLKDIWLARNNSSPKKG